MRLFRSAGLLIALASGACATGIKVTHVTSTIATQTGNPWNLPMTQFTVTITRHIVQCGAAIKGSVEVLPTPAVAIDDAQRYVLESKGRWGTSDITSSLAPSGISTGLNAESTDATATVIANVIGTVASIAVGVARAGPVAQLCEAPVAAAVDELYPPETSSRVPLRTQVDEATAALEVATAQVALLTAQVKADATLKPKLVMALADQDAKKTNLTALQKKLAAHLKTTTDVQVVTWPLRSSDFRTVSPFNLPADVFDAWTTQDASAADAAKFAVHFALYRHDGGNGGWLPAEGVMSGAGAVDVSVGVPVRLAQVGRLLTCVAEACPTTALPEGPSTDPLRTSNDLPVLQLGQMYVVPVAGGLFKSESAIIALDANGLPTSIQVAEKASTAAVASGAAKDAATQLAALPAQLSAARLARTQARIDQLNANAALATAQANAGVQGQTSALAAQTALITAQTNLATAQANAGLPIQTSALDAQTALLNAQAALALAQANAGNVNQTSAWAAQASLANAQAAQINAASALAKAQAGTQ